MATPLSTPSQAPCDTDEIMESLSALPRSQRIKAMRPLFKTTQLLERITLPPLCEAYPPLAEDIFDAYLTFTTFTIKVWVNYDTACKQFFFDRRIEGCGKVMMSPRDLRQFRRSIRNHVQLRRLRFEVATPFETLCWLSLRVVNGDTIRATYQPQTGEHPRVMQFIEDLCQSYDGYQLSTYRQGFDYRDIEKIAMEVRREPTEHEVERARHPFALCEMFMDLENGHCNEGWTDFDALERRRRLGG